MAAQPSTLAAPRLYGAYELKRYYQKSMMLGIMISSLLALGSIGGVLLYQYIMSQQGDVEAVGVIRIQTLADIAPPPSMTAAQPQIQVAEPDIAPPSIGIPTPVPDEEVVEEVRFATREELAQLSAPVGSGVQGGQGDSVVIDIPVEEYFPAPDAFVAVEEMPVEIRHETPVYPEMASLTERSGTVWVQALVDKDGKVRDARILKPSGANVGFEEAALDAAYKNVYKPAIQNGRPVAVWVSYKVDFVFRR
ncbi:MAG: energy transducer TonB [Candidatus Zixiibacteriota bacterium]